MSTMLSAFLSSGKEFVNVINRHNIFSFSSSLSYYSALALAPFLLILLKVGSLLGQDKQEELVFQAEFILGGDVAKVIQMIFSNINEGVNLASLSGLVGVIFLLLTVSMVFIELRYSLDFIKGDYNPDKTKTIKELIKERLSLMVVVIGTAVLFFLSIFLSNIVKFFAGEEMDQYLGGKIALIILNFIISAGLFTAVYFFVPSKKTKISDALKMAIFTSFFFLIGKILIGLYLEKVAGNSVYGAAGSLLAFLVWTYYSSFILFLSMELFLFIQSKKMPSGPKSIIV